MRDTAERKKRKKQESGPSHSKEKVTTVEELTDIKRARVSLSPVGVDNPNVTECLQLYFKCRCDDVEAWKQLQEKAENDEVAKAFVCDVLVHNEVFYRVSKDIEKAQHISKDIHYWIAATETDNNPTTHATKMYISGICLAQGIGIPKNQARAAKSIEEVSRLQSIFNTALFHNIYYAVYSCVIELIVSGGRTRPLSSAVLRGGMVQRWMQSHQEHGGRNN